MTPQLMERENPGRRWLAGASLAIFSLLVMGYLWWGRFDYHHALWSWVAYGGGVTLALLNHVLQRDRLKRLGLRLDNFLSAAADFGGFTLLAGLALVLAGLLYRRAFVPTPLMKVIVYAGWALAQQHFLQNFLRLRSEDLFDYHPQRSDSQRRGWVALLLAASLFALYHLPNPSLTAFTFCGALIWGRLFRRTPSLPWAALSHVGLSVILLGFFRTGLLDQFGVGRPGYRYDYYGGGVKVAGGIDAHEKPFVATLPGPDQGVSASVRVFDIHGRPRAQWVAFEGLDFSGELAVGDLGFGPGDEIAAAPGPGEPNPPLVRIFDVDGNRLSEFWVEGMEQGYGLWIAVACGRIYAAPGPAPGAPQIAVELSPLGRVLRKWKLDLPGLHNGLRVTALCQPSGEPARLLAWGSDIAVNPSSIFLIDGDDGGLLKVLPTLDTTFGVQAALMRSAGRQAIAVAPGPLAGYPPLIHVIDLDGNLIGNFALGSEGEATCGATVGAVDANGDGVDEILIGSGYCPNQPSTVHVYELDGRPLEEWNAYPKR